MSLALFNHLLVTFRKMSQEQYGCFFNIVSENEFSVKIYENEDLRALSMFIRTMKDIKRAGTVKIGYDEIKVKKIAGDESYLIIKCNNYREQYINFNSEKISIHGCYNNKYKQLMFFSSKKIYFEFNKTWKPANLKTFGYINSILKNILFSYFSQENPLWWDFMQCRNLPSFSLELINASRNIHELLENKFKITLPKTVNKKPIAVMYAACCAMQYVPENQSHLLIFSDLDEVNMRGSQKDIAISYISKIIYKKINSDYDDEYIIDDYLRMAINAKEKINMSLGKNGYKNLHDELASKIRLKGRGKKLKIPDTPLAKLKLPKDYIRITTKEELERESKRNNHCVWNYAGKIEKGKCLIYTLDYNNEHSTIEIGYRHEKYCLCQIRKEYNKSVSGDTLKYVKNTIDAINKNGKIKN